MFYGVTCHHVLLQFSFALLLLENVVYLKINTYSLLQPFQNFSGKNNSTQRPSQLATHVYIYPHIILWCPVSSLNICYYYQTLHYVSYSTFYILRFTCNCHLTFYHFRYDCVLTSFKFPFVIDGRTKYCSKSIQFLQPGY